MIQIKAQLNGLRMAPRKVRLLVNLIKRKNVQMAMDQLAFMAKRASTPLSKLLASAAANAQSKHKIDRDALVIKDMWVDEGVKLKRYRPKGFGRANPIEKKTSRVNVILEAVEVVAPAKKKSRAKATKAGAAPSTETNATE